MPSTPIIPHHLPPKPSGKSTATFMGLPWDIRKLILRELLDVHKNRKTTQLTRDGVDRALPRDDFTEFTRRYRGKAISKTTCKLETSILNVCKQLNGEGVHILLHENHFTAIVPRAWNYGFSLSFNSLVEQVKERGIPTWQPNWYWNSMERRFYTAAGPVSPTLTISFDYPDVDGAKPLLVSAADTEALATEVSLWQFSNRQIFNSREFKNRWDLKLYFKSEPHESLPSNVEQTTINEFLSDDLFLHLEEYTNSIAIGARDTINLQDYTLDKEAENSWRVSALFWHHMNPEVRDQTIECSLPEDVKKIAEAIEFGDLTRAFMIFETLLNKFHRLMSPHDIRNTPSPERGTLRKAFALACLHLAMQDDAELLFETPTSFWKWAICHIQSSLSHLHSLSTAWTVRIHLRLAELKLHLNMSFDHISLDLAIAISRSSPPDYVFETFTVPGLDRRSMTTVHRAQRYVESRVFGRTVKKESTVVYQLNETGRIRAFYEIKLWKEFALLRWGRNPELQVKS